MSRFEDDILQLSPKRLALLCLELKAELDAVRGAAHEPIAVIGMACRFPGAANSPEAFWELLRRGADATTEVPPERWDRESFYDADPDAPGKMYCWRGGFLDAVDQFDAHFFDITPREAVNIDPQQRLLLEVSWESLERAGLATTHLSGTRTGVYFGISLDDYARIQIWHGDPTALNAYTGTGSTLSCAAGRVAYVLGLQGPTLVVDTACSSSLVSVHLASQSLRARECDLALAGGVNLMLAPDSGIFLCKARALAPDGRCKTFDASADGYGRSEGCGVVVLRRLSDALASREPVLAVIRGSATNHDGPSSAFTVPNGKAQESVIRAALASARVDPSSISYVEAHGTGTPLGDPIEVQALADALRAPGRRRPIVLSSVKANVGHAESAAGIAGLIKTILALQHQEIPPHVHLREVNPLIHLDDGPFVIPTAPTAWESAGGSRVAGVSSFGLSGTNAHVVVEEAPVVPQPQPAVDRPLHLLTVSSPHADTLSVWAGRLHEQVSAHPDGRLPDVCHTANVRSHFDHRAAVIGRSREEMLERLSSLQRAERSTGVRTARGAAAPRSVAFLFSGQGAQYAGMARELYQTQPRFRRTVEECAAVLRAHLDLPLLEVLYDEPREGAIDETRYTQPALFAVEYALADLWISWGIRPSLLIGHSVGEYVAACAAGVMTLADALGLVAERARLMQQVTAPGRMAAVFADEATAAEAIEPHRGELAIAAVNGPRSVVLSGASAPLEQVVGLLQARGIQSRWLTVSHAFHSPLMRSVLDDFARAASAIRYSEPKVRLVSNVTGALHPEKGQASWPEYWLRHLMAPVRFADGVVTAHRLGCTAFVETGPTPQLLASASETVAGDDVLWCPSLRRGRPDWEQMLESLADLYVHGAEVDWAGFEGDYARTKVTLPARPLKPKRYWLDGVGRIGLPDDSKRAQRDAGPASAPANFPGRPLGDFASLPDEHIWELELDLASFPYMADHHMGEMIVAPMAVFVDMARAAAREALDAPSCVVEDLALHKPLFWTERAGRTVQLRLHTEPGGARFYASSRPLTAQGKSAWTLHATATIRLREARQPAGAAR